MAPRGVAALDQYVSPRAPGVHHGGISAGNGGVGRVWDRGVRIRPDGSGGIGRVVRPVLPG